LDLILSNRFYVPDEVSSYYREIGKKGGELVNKWEELFAAYKEKFPELAVSYEAEEKG
jgi:transketolase